MHYPPQTLAASAAGRNWTVTEKRSPMVRMDACEMAVFRQIWAYKLCNTGERPMPIKRVLRRGARCLKWVSLDRFSRSCPSGYFRFAPKATIGSRGPGALRLDFVHDVVLAHVANNL
jgi:hypothetical protein